MKLIISALVTFALVFQIAAVTAADKHGHAEAKPQHGGSVVEVSDVHYELVAKDGALVIYVSDHDNKALSTVGWSGKLSAIGAAEKIAADLKPGASGTLQAKGAFKVSRGTRLLASIEAPGKKPVQVRFTVK